MLHNKLPELVCPAGSLPALRAAVDNGADTVYFGYKNDTNARNFAGLNFDHKAMVEGIHYAQTRGKQVLMAINTFPQPGARGRVATRRRWRRRPRRRRGDPGRHRAARLCLQASPRTAPAPLGAGLGDELRSGQFRAPRIRRQTRGAAARTDARASRAGDQEHADRNRGVRLRQPVRHERGALLALLVRHRRIAQHRRRVLTGQIRQVGESARADEHAPQRHPDRPLRRR